MKDEDILKANKALNEAVVPTEGRYFMGADSKIYGPTAPDNPDSSKIISEGWEGDIYVTRLKYTPQPTCFNKVGIEHFGSNCDGCGCSSCNHIRGGKPNEKIYFNTRCDGHQ